MTSAQPMHLEFLLENGQCSNNNDRINASAYTTEVGERANARIKPPPGKSRWHSRVPDLQAQRKPRVRYMATIVDYNVAFMAAFSVQPCRIRRVSCASNLSILPKGRRMSCDGKCRHGLPASLLSVSKNSTPKSASSSFICAVAFCYL